MTNTHEQKTSKTLSKMFLAVEQEIRNTDAMVSVWDKIPEDQVQRLRDRTVNARQRREEKNKKMTQILNKFTPKKS